jgi:hypothetical protein
MVGIGTGLGFLPAGVRRGESGFRAARLRLKCVHSLRNTLRFRVEVAPADPDRADLLNSLAERALEHPVPDVISHTDSGATEFRHVFAEADSESDAYDRRWVCFRHRKGGRRQRLRGCSSRVNLGTTSGSETE